ncbi:CGNR zinc finger domain-containing protein [Streptosporangiaceae bacterium NEAU-GS5]|nr:CGNR zinc finger domain-containing protein [Streptosporangiaceae bacterium NEAU-GS5]
MAQQIVDPPWRGVARRWSSSWTATAPDRFGQCAAHQCEAVYIDLTRTTSRRYCSAATTSTP